MTLNNNNFSFLHQNFLLIWKTEQSTSVRKWDNWTRQVTKHLFSMLKANNSETLVLPHLSLQGFKIAKHAYMWPRLSVLSVAYVKEPFLKFDTMNVSEIFSILHKLWHVTSHRVKCFAKKCSHGRKLHIFAIPFRSHRGTIVRQDPRKCCTEPKGTWCKYFRKRAYLQGNKEHKQLKANVLSSLMQSLAFYHRTKKKNSSYPRTSSSLTSMHRNSNQPLLHLTRTAACTSRTHTRK